MISPVWEAATGLGKIIAIANQKGGVGKTTTAINLACSLATAEQRILLIDCDPQGNTTSGLGVERQSGVDGLYAVLIGERTLLEVAHPTEVAEVQLVTATPDLIGAEVELLQIEGREGILKRALESVKHRFDYLLLDCPPSLGLLTVNALTAADSVLIPVQCEYYAMEGLTLLLGTIRRVQETLNPPLKIEGILLTMYDGRNNLSSQVVQEVRAHFAQKVFDTVIPRNVALSEAPSHGKPILLYDIRSKGAQSYLQLAKEVIIRGQDGAR